MIYWVFTCFTWFHGNIGISMRMGEPIFGCKCCFNQSKLNWISPTIWWGCKGGCYGICNQQNDFWTKPTGLVCITVTSQYLGFNWISRGNLLGLGVFYIQSRTPGGVDHFFFQYCCKEMWFFWDERKSLRHHNLGGRTSWNHTALVFWMLVFVNTKMGLNQETQGYYWYDP